MRELYEVLTPRLAFQSVSMEELLVRYLPRGFREGLNVGSKSVCLGPAWTNVDLVDGPEVDVVADAHHLPFQDGSYDAVVLSAVLQYCKNPFQVVEEVARVLRPGGIVVANVPFLQPVCPEVGSADRFRFTLHGLRGMFEDKFKVLDADTALGPGSVLASTVRSVADHAADNRYVSALSRLIAGWASAPVARILRHGHPDHAGALYLVGRRRSGQ